MDKFKFWKNKKQMKIVLTAIIVAVCLVGISAAARMQPQDQMSQENAQTEAKKEEANTGTDDGQGEKAQAQTDGTQDENAADGGADVETQTAGNTIEKKDGSSSGDKIGNKNADAGDKQSDSAQAGSGQSTGEDQGGGTGSGSGTGGAAAPGGSGNGGTSSGSGQGTQEKQEITCSIEIRCDSICPETNGGKYILTAYGNPHLEQYAASPMILSSTKVKVKNGTTVYEVLKSVCQKNNIPLAAESSKYGMYVQGINHLFEFSAGDNSGWMYAVNGKFPSVGCSGYKLSEGDKITWQYVCR